MTNIILIFHLNNMFLLLNPNSDINDNAPIFVNTPYEATVAEVGQ